MPARIGRVLLAATWPPLSMIVTAFLLAVVGVGWFLDKQPPGAPADLVYFTLYYLIAATLAVWPWRRLLFGANSQLREALGILNRPRFKDAWLALVYFALYVLAAMVVAVIIRQLFPLFDIEKSQNLYVQQPVTAAQFAYAFVALVVLPPVAEELIFRGFMLGALGRQMSFWPAAILTSLVFAALHGQLNVAIDIFVLSLFLAKLRHKTGSVWAPMLTHVLKNGLAFLLLFVFVVK